MASYSSALLLAFMLMFISDNTTAAKKQVFIVHMDHDMKPGSFSTHHLWYASIVQSLNPEDHDPLIYNYAGTVFHGFAARLYPHQAQFLRDEMDAVIDVHQDRQYSVLTTRTPQFLGLEDTNYLGMPSYAELDKYSHNLVIGVIDSGVWPESKSFDDAGMPTELPKSWKGECERAPDFDPKRHCNNKLIGARASLKSIYLKLFGNSSSHDQRKYYVSPRSITPHGTFTASIAAGSSVPNASLFGYAAGKARGMATHARLAMYRVLWNSTAISEADVLHGIIQAVEDGVDVLSMSIGVPQRRQYHEDPIAKATFVAARMGIIISCAAGNLRQKLIINVAPWIITVGAGTLDRSFPASVLLGNNKRHFGQSLSNQKSRPLGETELQVPLVYIHKGSNHSSGSHMCLPGSLEPTTVCGKIVVCDIGITANILPVIQGLEVKNAGGVGMILANTAAKGEEPIDESSHVLPAVTVGEKVGDLVRAYVMSEPHPTAALSFGRTDYNLRPAPIVPKFSSRGPNTITPQILKPDLIAPGYQILSAWPNTIPVTGLEQDSRRSLFNIVSGTSVSCPHISGIAALIKVAYPNWSHSAIKSAMMTTAYTIDNTGLPILDNATGQLSNPLAYGSGHVDPRKALSPGLVYDTSTEEYTMFLCSLNYTLKQVRAIVKRNNTCLNKFSDPGQLNYPSFSVVFQNKVRVVRYTRKVTNVGPARSIYNVTVSAPPSVDVTIRPSRMVFESEGQKKRYTATFVAKKNAYGRSSAGNFSTDSGHISWSNAQHKVRSPVVFMWA